MPYLRHPPMVEALEDTPKELRGQQAERYIFELQMLRNQGHPCVTWALQTLAAYDQQMAAIVAMTENKEATK